MTEPTQADLKNALRAISQHDIAQALADRYAQGVANERARAAKLARQFGGYVPGLPEEIATAIERGETP